MRIAYIKHTTACETVLCPTSRLEAWCLSRNNSECDVSTCLFPFYKLHGKLTLTTCSFGRTDSIGLLHWIAYTYLHFAKQFIQNSVQPSSKSTQLRQRIIFHSQFCNGDIYQKCLQMGWFWFPCVDIVNSYKLSFQNWQRIHVPSKMCAQKKCEINVIKRKDPLPIACIG